MKRKPKTTTPKRSEPLPEPEALRDHEAARLLDVSRRALQMWRLRGEGPPFVKYGDGRMSPVRYRRADLLRWLDERTVRQSA